MEVILVRTLMAWKMAASLVSAGALLALPAAVQAKSAGPVALTRSGAVAGVAAGKTVQYLGLPYAAPPVDALRWRPPVAPAAWQGVRPANKMGLPCAQIITAGGFGGPANNNEDCLTLNVFAPSAAAAGKTKMPVFVWFHGGGYFNGSGNDYDGSKLAAMGNVIVVSINYRLNLLGFLAHPALDGEGHGFANYGLQDQQFAMKWVKDNIAAFGGDPGNVTIGGQSAGGSSVGTHLVSPLAKGLFEKAIIESAGSYMSVVPLDRARARGIAFAKAAGCGEGTDEATAVCLRKLPVDAIEKLIAMPFSPYLVTAVQDGTLIPSGAASAFAEGRFTKVPVINGTVQDEGGLYTGLEMFGDGTQPWRTITQDSVNGMVKAVYGANAAKILAAYPVANYPTAQLRSNAIQSDAFVCKAQHATHLLAGKVPLYVYEFRDRAAPTFLPDMPGYVAQAYHTSELQYLFPGFHGTGIQRELNPVQKRLSDRMVTAFTNFMRTGNPNAKGNQPWPAYTTKANDYVAFNSDGLGVIGDAKFSIDHRCNVWADILSYN